MTCPDAAPPLQQSAEFAAALGLFGRAPLRLGDGTLVLRRRIGPGLPLAMLPRARCGPDLAGWLAAAGLSRWPLILAPDRPAPDLADRGAVPLVTPQHLAELDLTPGPEALLRRFEQKWRNRLAHARARGLRLQRHGLDSEIGRWLLAADARQGRRRGYRGWPDRLTRAYAAANPGRATVLSAWREEAPVAAVLILRHGAAASYHIGHSLPEGRSASAHNLLIWNAILDLCAAGSRRLELGLVDTETAPGLARFKLGTGAAVRPLGGTWGWWPPLGRGLAPLARLDRARMAGARPDNTP